MKKNLFVFMAIVFACVSVCTAQSVYVGEGVTDLHVLNDYEGGAYVCYKQNDVAKVLHKKDNDDTFIEKYVDLTDIRNIKYFNGSDNVYPTCLLVGKDSGSNKDVLVYLNLDNPNSKKVIDIDISDKAHDYKFVSSSNRDIFSYIDNNQICFFIFNKFSLINTFTLLNANTENGFACYESNTRADNVFGYYKLLNNNLVFYSFNNDNLCIANYRPIENDINIDSFCLWNNDFVYRLSNKKETKYIQHDKTNIITLTSDIGEVTYLDLDTADTKPTVKVVYNDNYIYLPDENKTRIYADDYKLLSPLIDNYLILYFDYYWYICSTDFSKTKTTCLEISNDYKYIGCKYKFTECSLIFEKDNKIEEFIINNDDVEHKTFDSALKTRNTSNIESFNGDLFKTARSIMVLNTNKIESYDCSVFDTSSKVNNKKFLVILNDKILSLKELSN